MSVQPKEKVFLKFDERDNEVVPLKGEQEIKYIRTVKLKEYEEPAKTQ